MQTDRYCFSWMILQNICSAIFLFLDSQSNIGFLFCGTFYLMGCFTFRDERSRRLGVGETSTHAGGLSLLSTYNARLPVIFWNIFYRRRIQSTMPTDPFPKQRPLRELHLQRPTPRLKMLKSPVSALRLLTPLRFG